MKTSQDLTAECVPGEEDITETTRSTRMSTSDTHNPDLHTIIGRKSSAVQPKVSIE